MLLCLFHQADRVCPNNELIQNIVSTAENALFFKSGRAGSKDQARATDEPEIVLEGQPRFFTIFLS